MHNATTSRRRRPHALRAGAPPPPASSEPVENEDAMDVDTNTPAPTPAPASAPAQGFITIHPRARRNVRRHPPQPSSATAPNASNTLEPTTGSNSVLHRRPRAPSTSTSLLSRLNQQENEHRRQRRRMLEGDGNTADAPMTLDELTIASELDATADTDPTTSQSISSLDPFSFLKACEWARIQDVQQWLNYAEQNATELLPNTFRVTNHHGAAPFLLIVAQIAILDATNETEKEEKKQWVQCAERVLQLGAQLERTKKVREDALHINPVVDVPPERRESVYRTKGLVHGANTLFHLLYSIWDNECFNLLIHLCKNIHTVDVGTVDVVTKCTPIMFLCIYKCPKRLDNSTDNTVNATVLLVTYSMTQTKKRLMPSKRELSWEENVNLAYVRNLGEADMNAHAFYWTNISRQTSCFYYARDTDFVRLLRNTDTMYAFFASIPANSIVTRVFAHNELPFTFLSSTTKQTVLHALIGLYTRMLQAPASVRYFTQTFEMIQTQMERTLATNDMATRAKYMKMLNVVAEQLYVFGATVPDADASLQLDDTDQHSLHHQPYLKYQTQELRLPIVLSLLNLYTQLEHQVYRIKRALSVMEQQQRHQVEQIQLMRAKLDAYNEMRTDVQTGFEILVETDGVDMTQVNSLHNSVFMQACITFKKNVYAHYETLTRVFTRIPFVLRGAENTIHITPIKQCVRDLNYPLVAYMLHSAGGDVNLTQTDDLLKNTVLHELVYFRPTHLKELQNLDAVDAERWMNLVQRTRKYLVPIQTTFISVEEHDYMSNEQYLLKVLLTMLRIEPQLLVMRNLNGLTPFDCMVAPDLPEFNPTTASAWADAIEFILQTPTYLKLLMDDGNALNVSVLWHICSELPLETVKRIFSNWRKMRVEAEILSQTETGEQHLHNLAMAMLHGVTTGASHSRMMMLLVHQGDTDAADEYINNYANVTEFVVMHLLENGFIRIDDTDTTDDNNNLFAYLIQTRMYTVLTSVVTWIIQNVPEDALPNVLKSSILSIADEQSVSNYHRICAFPSSIGSSNVEDDTNADPTTIQPSALTLHKLVTQLQLNGADREQYIEMVSTLKDTFANWVNLIASTPSSHSDPLDVIPDDYQRSPLSIALQAENWDVVVALLKSPHLSDFNYLDTDLTGMSCVTHAVANYYRHLETEGQGAEHAATKNAFKIAQEIAKRVYEQQYRLRVSGDPANPSWIDGNPFPAMVADETAQRLRVKPLDATEQLRSDLVEDVQMGREMELPKKATDVFGGGEVNIASYLREKPHDRMCIYYHNNAYVYELSDVLRFLTPSFVKWKCMRVDSMNPDYIDTEFAFFGMRSLGIPADYALARNIYTMIALTFYNGLPDNTHNQFAVFAGTKTPDDVIPSTISLYVWAGIKMRLDISIVSASHCQEGQGGNRMHAFLVERPISDTPVQGEDENEMEEEQELPEPAPANVINVMYRNQVYPIDKSAVHTVDDLKRETLNAVGISREQVRNIRFLYMGKLVEATGASAGVDVETIPAGNSVTAVIALNT